MRSERLYLNDIVEAADAIGRFVRETSAEEFPGSKLVRSAVVMKLMIIGEAAACVSADLRDRHPEVGWSAATELRDVLVERYYAIDWDAVWNAATQSVPLLREQVAQILGDEFPDKETDN